MSEDSRTHLPQALEAAAEHLRPVPRYTCAAAPYSHNFVYDATLKQRPVILEAAGDRVGSRMMATTKLACTALNVLDALRREYPEIAVRLEAKFPHTEGGCANL